VKSNVLCLNCGKIITSKTAIKFCSRSCSATYTNLKRLPRTEESKNKVRESLNKMFKAKKVYKTNIFIFNCKWCKNIVIWNEITKGSKIYCSKKCCMDFKSSSQTNRLKNDVFYRSKLGRGKKSYMESSFEEWLIQHKVNFITEKHFYNFTLNKNYFVDFYFPDLNLVIELDGNQHLKTKELDKLRDEYLTTYYGLNILRISHTEYKEKTKLDLVCKLLNLERSRGFEPLT